MPSRTTRSAPITVSFTEEERERTKRQAQMRGLAESSFIRLIVLGAMASTNVVDRCVTEATRRGTPVGIKSAARVGLDKLWERDKVRGKGTWWYVPDRRWVLVKPNPYANARHTDVNRDGWRLINPKLGLTIALSLHANEAKAMAADYIQEERWKT